MTTITGVAVILVASCLASSIRIAVPLHLVSRQRNIIGPLNIQVLPILPLLLLLLPDHVGGLGKLVPANLLAFGGGETGDAAAEEGG